MKICQHNPEEHSTVAAIEDDLSALEIFQSKAKVEEVDNYGLPVESTRQAEYIQVKKTYRNQLRELLVTKKALEASAKTPAEKTRAQLAESIKSISRGIG